MSLIGKAKALAKATKSGVRWEKPATIEAFRALIEFAPRRHQLEILLASTARFAVHICHRRFGKTVLFVNYLVERAFFCPFDLGEYAYAAPTYKQAERIAWKYLEKACSKIPGAVFKKSDLEVTIPTARGSTATIRLFGLDNPKQSLRGAYLDGVVFDETSGIPKSQWTQVVRAMLADDCRRGADIFGRPNQWAEFIGTVAGRDWFWQLYADAKIYQSGGFTVETDERTGRSTKVFSDDWSCGLYRADQTGIISPEELESIRRDSPDDYAQEFLCDPDAAIRGSVYGDQLDLCAELGNFVEVPIDRSLPVNTAWDLGWDDATAIWFFQQRGEYVILVDYLEINHTDLETLAHELHTRSYAGKAFRYGYHLLPHDVKVHEIGRGERRIEILRSAGLQRVYAVDRRNEPELIAAARKLIPKCIFSLSATAAGVTRMRQYRRKLDEKTLTYSKNPVHDNNSHAASAFQQLAIGLRKDHKHAADPNNAAGAEV